jgi:hypothetical protein
LPDHLVDLLARAELLAREDLDLDLVVGALGDVLREVLGGEVRRLGGGERVRKADADHVLGDGGRRLQRGDQRQDEQRQFHGVSPGKVGGGGDVGRAAHFWFWSTSASLPGWAAPA